MFCTKCGTELHEGDFFCSKCGASQTSMTSVPNEQSAQNQQPSNAQSMNEQSINPQPSNVEFTNMSSSYMQTTHREPKPLQQQVTPLVSSNEGNHDSDKKVRKERKKGSTKKISIPIVVLLAILLVVAEIDDSGKYFLDDYEKEYKYIKEAFTEDLEAFDEDACRKDSKKFEKIRDDIKDYNQSIIASYDETITDFKESGNNNYYEVELELLTEKTNSYQEAVASGNNNKIRSSYQDFMELKAVQAFTINSMR